MNVIRIVALLAADSGIKELGVLRLSTVIEGDREAADPLMEGVLALGNSLDGFCLGGRHACCRGLNSLTDGDAESVSSFFSPVSSR